MSGKFKRESIMSSVSSYVTPVVSNLWETYRPKSRNDCLALVSSLALGAIAKELTFAGAVCYLAYKYLTIEKGPVGKLVGELHEKWVSLSDHLQIAMKLDEFTCFSWNSLNQKYIDNITKDSQGLNGSVITSSSSEERRRRIIEEILHFMKNTQGPKILALQECSPQLIQTLQTSLPRLQFSFSGYKDSEDSRIFIYDPKDLKFISRKVIPFAGHKGGRNILDIELQSTKTGKHYRLINVHLPKQCKAELTAYIEGLENKANQTIVVMGDMNFDELTMKQAFSKTSLNLVPPSYPTTVNTRGESKAYDQF